MKAFEPHLISAGNIWPGDTIRIEYRYRDSYHTITGKVAHTKTVRGGTEHWTRDGARLLNTRPNNMGDVVGTQGEHVTLLKPATNRGLHALDINAELGA